ncbi:MAG: cobyrinate a,c-diamide synthase [Lachnospiraceae bacterium]|nr:cobyrinate a,c-diamide synthase [Lachnospiraceae bacterium]
MNRIASKRILIGAVKSGSGKTTLTCAILQALKKRGLHPVSFKCGPDYIDPMFHREVLGIDSRNLDTYFAGTEGVKHILSEAKEDYAVIEGVMGLYDGAAMDSTAGSAYEIAKTTGTPIILIVDASGAGRTILSVIKGIILDDNEHLIKGVILNKATEKTYRALKEQLNEEASIIGYFPKNEDLAIKSRHLGLIMPGEIEDIRSGIAAAGDMLEQSVDMQKLIQIMEEASEAACEDIDAMPSRKEGEGLTLAVARDEAFCFYYRDNLDLFKELGVKIEYFSPIHDSEVPKNADGMLLGGGYPENYLKELSDNKSMLSSVKRVIEKGIPSLAECGGFMYLHDGIEDCDGRLYEMAGIIPGKCARTSGLVRFGYMYVDDAAEQIPKDDLYMSLVGMKGHEFHYYDSTANGDSYTLKKPYIEKEWRGIVTRSNGVWGFPHFYYRSSPNFIICFIRRMKEVRA